MSRPKAGSDCFTDAHALYSVDTSRAKDGVWLVKVPKYLAELWRKSGPDGVVGKVVIASSPAPGQAEGNRRPVGSQVTLVTDPDLLAHAGETGDLIPKEHQFFIQTSASTSSAASSRPGQSSQRRVSALSGQELIILAEDDLAVAGPSSTGTVCSSETDTSATRPSSPFSNSSSARYSRRLSLFGRVNSRAECRPPPNTRYMMLKAQQMKEINRPKHEVRLLYEPVRNYKPVANHISNIEYEARKRAEGKNLRREKDDVMQDLFKAFERHQYYTIRDLILLTKQPVTYLTEILKEIAIFNPRAPHKNMWELKPEYRHYAPSESSKVLEEKS
ncbi:transcription initiation factor TFIIF subunit beta [Clonorchis sinensis]|uniref:General transcription factor IIF subunit 2 n=2 Tax=Clonorchis sinensis TaxID=79923 RepID=H2KR30_CLOSI|nr:transcription initiation factor TFIIF subunit beta [Clonorchis sinensis]